MPKGRGPSSEQAAIMENFLEVAARVESTAQRRMGVSLGVVRLTLEALSTVRLWEGPVVCEEMV